MKINDSKILGKKIFELQGIINSQRKVIKKLANEVYLINKKLSKKKEVLK